MSAAGLNASGPPNDLFANATSIPSLVGVGQLGTNVGATKEVGEPEHYPGNPGGASVWWKWVAPSSGPVRVTTSGSTFDTVLAVYTGSSLTSLQLIGFDDDTLTSVTSEVPFAAVAGTTYVIAVDGYGGSGESPVPATGNIQINVVAAAAAPAILSPPLDRRVLAGQPATFSVTASGSAPLGYLWQRLPAGGSAWISLEGAVGYSGAETSTLTVSSTTVAMDGDEFRCTVTNTFGGITSPAAMLLVDSPTIPPLIETQPASQAVPEGQPATFTVVALGSAPLGYRWQRLTVGSNVWLNLGDSGVFSGAVTASLRINPTSRNQNGEQYRCIVSNAAGDVTTAPATLTVSAPNEPPAFSSSPASITANEGNGVSFSVVVSGNPAPAIQWQRSTDNGSTFLPISGATGPTLSFSTVAFSQNGHRFRAVATNSAGSATSSVATLTVIELILPTTITLQPTGGTFNVGQSVTLTVAATGTGTLAFQWYRDGRPIAGATGSSLALNNLAAGSSASYHVVVQGRGGEIGSSGVFVTVISPPAFTVQPVDATVQTGLSGSFRAVAVGDPDPSLQWFRRSASSGAWQALTDGPGVSGARSEVLTLDAVPASLDGLQVQARATNSAATTESAIATLRTLSPSSTLRIATQPQSVLARAGQSTAFSVLMEGTGPFTYQWSQNGVTRVGAIGRICNLNNVNADLAGGYSVVVRDAEGRSVTSNVAFLTVAGAVDNRFDPRGGANAEVTGILTLADGSYLVTGSFNRFAGFARRGLVRVLANGRVDTTFEPGLGPNGPVQGMLELADGRVILVGQFDRFDREIVPGVVRIDTKGRVDPTFNALLPKALIGRESEIPERERFHYAIIGLRNGGYLLGGKLGIVVLNSSGITLPESVFKTTGAVYALLQQYDDGILAAGDFTLMSGFVRAGMARITPDYRMDLTFDVGTGANGTIRNLLRAPDGGIYVMGSFTAFNGQPRPSGIARIGRRGALDPLFNPPLAPLTAGTGGSVLASGRSTPAAGRLDAIRAGRVQPDGGLVVTNGAGNNQSVVAVSPTGAIVAEADVPVQGAANALTYTPDGDVAVGGDFSAIAGTPRANVGVVTDAAEASRLTNLSCRARVSPTLGVLILGFVIEGPDSMRILIRGVGPTLRAFNITDALNRPQLTLFNGAGQAIVTNLGWQIGTDAAALGAAMRQVGAFDLSSPDDTAILVNLPPGSYTAHIGGRDGTQGVTLGEIYAVDVGRSRLINSSVRGPVGTGQDLLIPGFTISGGSRLMLARAIGPGLAVFGVPGTLAQPRIELRRGGTNDLLSVNEGWTTTSDPAALVSRTLRAGAFPLSPTSADSAVLAALPAGGYTVVVSGVGGTTGAALVEVYDANGLDQPTPVQ